MAPLLRRPAIVLDVWSDVVCSWCYIAKHRLHQAVLAWERPQEVEIRHRAFETDTGLQPGERVPVADPLGRKPGGGVEGGRRMTDEITAAAREDGLTLNLDTAVAARSFDAHRLVALAREMGGPGLEQAALERMFSAHLIEGLAIDDHGVLQRISAEAGMDERRVAAVLAAESYAEKVRADEAEAQRLGITRVPFVRAGADIAVAGAQSVEAYLAMFRRVRRGPGRRRAAEPT